LNSIWYTAVEVLGISIIITLEVENSEGPVV